MFTFNLVKKAKNVGGDKYEMNESFNIYFPQEISRKNGKVKETIIIEVLKEEVEGSLLFELESAAKKSGGDKYKHSESFNIYFPQSISRENGKAVSKLYVVVKD